MDVIFNASEQFNVSLENEGNFSVNFLEQSMEITFVADDSFETLFSEGETFDCEFNMGGGGRSADEYHGSYRVTPSLQTQTLNTKDKILIANVTVDPIPNNYGLITWDGSTLTVS